VQQPGLQLDQVEAAGEGFEDGEFVPLASVQGQLFHELVEVGDEAITQAEFVLAGQAMQDRDDTSGSGRGWPR
jgi:hypothetical protein